MKLSNTVKRELTYGRLIKLTYFCGIIKVIGVIDEFFPESKKVRFSKADIIVNNKRACILSNLTLGCTPSNYSPMYLDYYLRTASDFGRDGIKLEDIIKPGDIIYDCWSIETVYHRVKSVHDFDILVDYSATYSGTFSAPIFKRVNFGRGKIIHYSRDIRHLASVRSYWNFIKVFENAATNAVSLDAESGISDYLISGDII